MRPLVPSLASLCSLFVIVSPALAGERGGGKGSGNGGGRLGAVSTGLGRAVSGSDPTPSSGGGGNRPDRRGNDGEYDGRYDAYILVPMSGGYAFVERRVVPPEPSASEPGATVDLFVGAQKVHESDGAATINIAFVENRFRLAGSLTRYFERQVEAPALQLTMPTLSGGFAVVDSGPTRVFLEGGFAYVNTDNDPVMDTAITGGYGGLHLEHAVTAKAQLVGDVQLMRFQHDVRASAARVGVRLGHLEAAFRVLDFSIGPALYGPELGLAF